MGMKWCPDGEHEVKVAFQPTAGERNCPKHGCALLPLPKKTGRQLGADRSDAETKAHLGSLGRRSASKAAADVLAGWREVRSA